MTRRIVLRSTVAAAVVALVSCSEAPSSMVSPSEAPGATTAAADGSTLKVAAPALSSPVGGERVSSVRPTFTFVAAAGRHVATTPGYRIEVLDADGGLVGARSLAAGVTTFTADADLARDRTFFWRVRAELDGAFGPWSAVASFQTPVPVVTAPPAGSSAGALPFPVPAECGPGYDVSNRIACVNAVARVSAEWGRCAGGNHAACNRFTRQVVFSLAQTDPDFLMIQAGAGGLACSCTSCGPSDGTMFREDTTVNNGRVFDMIVGAGGPSPGLGWSRTGNVRNVDTPRAAPLCP